MNATPDHDDRDRFARLVHTIRPGGTLIRAWPLEGGVSAQITAFEIAHPDGHMERMVVRQHGERDREYKPNIATDEFTLLAILGEAGVPAPKPIFVDQASAFFDTPCLVVQYTEGSTGIAPADEQHAGEHMATYLARLHTIDAIAHDLSFLPAVTARLERMLLDPPTADAPSPTAARIREALAVAWPLPRTTDSILLHGDFWPGNIMWRDREIVAVIDWEDSAIGDPLFDLASVRLELFWMFGAVAMHRFTGHYTSMTQNDLTDLPFWDLCAALDPAMHLPIWDTTRTPKPPCAKSSTCSSIGRWRNSHRGFAWIDRRHVATRMVG